MKTKIGILLTAAAFALCGCGDSNTPTGVVEQVLEAMKDGDAEEIIELQDLSDWQRDMLDSHKEQFEEHIKRTAEQQKDTKFEVLSEEVKNNGKRAKVKVKITKESGETLEQTFTVVNKEGKWKVRLN